MYGTNCIINASLTFIYTTDANADLRAIVVAGLTYRPILVIIKTKPFLTYVTNYGVPLTNFLAAYAANREILALAFVAVNSRAVFEPTFQHVGDFVLTTVRLVATVAGKDAVCTTVLAV